MVGGLANRNLKHMPPFGEPGRDALGASIWLLPAPGVVDSVESANLLKSERAISQSLLRASSAQIAFAGIGNPTRDSLLMRDEHIITWPELEALIGQGAVGDIGLRFYTINGTLIESNLNDRVIGISLDNPEISTGSWYCWRS